jgi:AraC-like DNA-binding protein
LANSASEIKQAPTVRGTITPMSTPADTFSRFLDVLAETLDDHATYGSALAARMHLSRFHFDRLVSGAAGEPPATLRRRVLLERAAYRLITTDDDVLEVALDAGYSSHEAFTRAFSRAYGTAPSRWRRRPTRFQIEAPSKVHFNPPGGLRVPAERKVTAMDLLLRMVEHHVWLVGEMLTRAETLGDDVLDARVEISVDGIDCEPTLRSLLSRLVGQLAMWDAATQDRPYDIEAERGETVAEMKAKLAEVGPAFLAQVRAILDEGRLDETFVDAVCDPPEVFTYGGMIAHVLTFAAHRRTLVCGALLDAGITDLGAGDPMRWVAEAA